MFCFIFFHVFSQSQKWQIQVGFEIHDWLRYSSSILKSLAIWGLKKKIIKIPILPKNSVLGDNKRFGLVVTNSKNSVNTFFFFVLCFSHHTSHHQKITKKEIRTAKFAMKILSKIHTFFFVMHTFAKAIIIFFVCTEPGWMDWKKNWDFSGRESQL